VKCLRRLFVRDVRVNHRYTVLSAGVDRPSILEIKVWIEGKRRGRTRDLPIIDKTSNFSRDFVFARLIFNELVPTMF